MLQPLGSKPSNVEDTPSIGNPHFSNGLHDVRTNTLPGNWRTSFFISGDEEKVYAAIELDETPIDSITQTTGLPSGTVSSTLLRLEMKRLVKQLPGKVFVRTS